AEDGIRDLTVTGVQTCALPILPVPSFTGYGTGAALLKLVKDGTGIRCEEQYFLPGNKFQNHHGQMILKDGHVYCGHGHNKGLPICLDMESGKIDWGGTAQGAGSDSAAVCYADGNLIFRYG